VVVFRADLTDGRKGVYLGSDGAITTVVETGYRFGDLALFPSINDAGTVAFGATLAVGGVGVFTASEGNLTTFVEPAAGFESLRNTLINKAGTVVFAGTPAGGKLGIFAGPDPVADRGPFPGRFAVRFHGGGVRPESGVVERYRPTGDPGQADERTAVDSARGPCVVAWSLRHTIARYLRLAVGDGAGRIRP